MKIPNCREDKDYNEEYLNEKGTMFISGSDYAVEQALQLLDNADVFPDFADLLSTNRAVVGVDKEEIVRDALTDWLESARNELITSMLDNMDESEYEANREKYEK